jgi:hypothetical protein
VGDVSVLVQVSCGKCLANFTCAILNGESLEGAKTRICSEARKDGWRAGVYEHVRCPVCIQWEETHCAHCGQSLPEHHSVEG